MSVQKCSWWRIVEFSKDVITGFSVFFSVKITLSKFTNLMKILEFSRELNVCAIEIHPFCASQNKGPVEIHRHTLQSPGSERENIVSVFLTYFFGQRKGLVSGSWDLLGARCPWLDRLVFQLKKNNSDWVGVCFVLKLITFS